MNIFKMSALILIVALCSYTVFLYFRPNPAQDQVRTRASTIPEASTAAQTRLFFSPSSIRISGNQSKEIPLMIQTEGNSIQLVQFEIQYDPEHLEVTEVRPAAFFTQPNVLLNEIDRNRGRIQFAMETDSEQDGVKGSGPVALITVTNTPSASNGAVTQMKFMPKTAVRSLRELASVLQSTEDLIIELPAQKPPLSPTL